MSFAIACSLGRALCLAVLATTATVAIPLPSSQATEPLAAETVNPPPAGLAKAIASIDAAANRRDLEAVMQQFAADFSHNDGLTKQELRELMLLLWKSYPTLTYNTEVKSWEKQKDGSYRVRTHTKIEGSRKSEKQTYKLLAHLTSEQVYRPDGDRWLVKRQDILSEKSTLTAGEKPPTLELKMPERIGVGRQYTLDAIVPEPLGANLYLGALVETPVSEDNYFKETTVDLAPLRAGGLFKIGQAPYRVGDRWISVVLIGEDGIAITGQRLQVRRDIVGNQYTPLPDTPTRSLIRPDADFTPSS